ncbi:MAG TPA: hypothetical protein VF883_08985 [Thermoanaerobaculia bacterium]|jgi:hypothetical protein
MALVVLLVFIVPLVWHGLHGLFLLRRLRATPRLQATVIQSEWDYGREEPRVTVRIETDGRQLERVIRWPTRDAKDDYPKAERGQSVQVFVDRRTARVYLEEPSKTTIAVELGMAAFLMLFVVLGVIA